jgi:hypothetical protein
VGCASNTTAAATTTAAAAAAAAATAAAAIVQVYTETHADRLRQQGCMAAVSCVNTEVKMWGGGIMLQFYQ